MANLETCQQDLTSALEEEGYQVSDGGSFEVQLYDHQNVMASTDPSLLSRDYGERIRLMDEINNKLALQLKRKKEKLALLIGNTRPPPGILSEPRRSMRLKNKRGTNKRDDYWYF